MEWLTRTLFSKIGVLFHGHDKIRNFPFRTRYMAGNAHKNARNSAAGDASHTPVIPKKRGRIRIAPVNNTKVRRKDKNADTFPLDKAVNIADTKIFSPLNKKLKEKIFIPPAAS